MNPILTVGEMMARLSEFPSDLEVQIHVDAVPRDEIMFDNYENEPEILYITR